MASRQTPVPLIALFGESPLVQEYAEVCLKGGYRVSTRFNRTEKAVKTPKGAKGIRRPVKHTSLVVELTNTSIEEKRRNLVEIGRSLPGKPVILSSCVTVTVAEQATWISQPERLIGIGAFPTLTAGSLLELVTLPSTSSDAIRAAEDLLATVGKKPAFVQDSVGLVMPRILCMLINEACFAMREGIAEARDIDTAMKLGTNYPEGPVEWANRIGVRHVQAVMAALYHAYGEDRYRVAPLLQRAVFLGGSSL